MQVPSQQGQTGWDLRPGTLGGRRQLTGDRESLLTGLRFTAGAPRRGCSPRCPGWGSQAQLRPWVPTLVGQHFLPAGWSPEF